ncbi:MAG: DUF5674 family protein [Candidatus Omnitrophica bacterium]|nr:DUF5674 family protein [Candidatus Omnitrophota bacterium]
MKIVDKQIFIDELKKIAEHGFGNLIKAVVDTEKNIIAIDGELHSDEEALLLENGSKQQDLWGINLYPDIEGEDWIEFDSLINIRPLQKNKSRGIDNIEIKKKIIGIVNSLVKK